MLNAPDGPFVLGITGEGRFRVYESGSMMPRQVVAEPDHRFLPLEPSGHLDRIVFSTGSRVGFLGEVDVEMLGGLCVQSVEAT